jgi:hypothetical protein
MVRGSLLGQPARMALNERQIVLPDTKGRDGSRGPRGWLRRVRITFLTVGVLAMAASVVGPTVLASADGYNGGWAYLRFDPPGGFQKCTYRDITLAAGLYRWRVYTAHWAHTTQGERKTATRQIWLRAGRYVWTNCIESGPHEYIHMSWLSIDSGALKPLSHEESGRPYLNGVYNFASALKRISR